MPTNPVMAPTMEVPASTMRRIPNPDAHRRGDQGATGGRCTHRPSEPRVVGMTTATKPAGEQIWCPSRFIEATGLAVGSGALYHHFKSKEALLEAAIDRQLDRRRAMRDIRAWFGGLRDLRAELTLLGRYLRTVLDKETRYSRSPPGQRQAGRHA